MEEGIQDVEGPLAVRGEVAEVLAGQTPRARQGEFMIYHRAGGFSVDLARLLEWKLGQRRACSDG